MSFPKIKPDENEFKIEIPMYQGPLDLLLKLIERTELDITEIALAEVTSPFLEYIRQLNGQEAKAASSFLVVAAKLMQIKSEALLPRLPERGPEEEDPANELVNQLIVYKRYKELATLLAQRDHENNHTYLRIAAPQKIITKLDLEDLDLSSLVEAATQVFSLAQINIPPISSIIKLPKITIKSKIAHITEFFKMRKKATFKKLLGINLSHQNIIVTFLAVLELTRQFRIKTTQETLFGDIEIEPDDSWNAKEEFDLELID